MNTSAASPHVHPTVVNQDRYIWRRRLLLKLMRSIGFGLLFKAEITGTDLFPESGPTLVAMNHIAALDPFVVTAAITARYMVPMSKVENYANPIVKLMADTWGVYPVRRGEVDRQALGSTIELLNQGHPVLIAPEGTRQVALSEPKDGMTYVALKANAMIVPVGVDGTEQFPASLKRLRRAPITIRFGRAFRFRTEGRKRIPRDEMRAMTQQAMYQIAQLLPEHRQGIYSDLSQAHTDLLDFVD
ncbi:MAG: 1-acyl-sn-glycerol-3-phosphate acyltransferase [Anaerolineae bacterium]|nr:1-acyl-sn-glycerol-3-phosphate acyltransferase [Anaerolineae bacterium]